MKPSTRIDLPGASFGGSVDVSVSITEQRPVSGPIVYGYLRLRATNPARRSALAAALSGYCRQHELALAGVFTDQGDELTGDELAGGVGQVRTAAFVGLLDALMADGSYGVVTPSPAHLGGRGVGAVRAELIAGTGRRLMLIRGTAVMAAAR